MTRLFADLAVKLPPVIRTTDIAAYSTNSLDFALNNGLGMTATLVLGA